MKALWDFYESNKDGFSVLSSDDLGKLQRILIGMTKDILDFCDSHNLKILMGGGSMLGAVRHRGIIPWDDDIDLNMPRRDYEIFKREFRKEMGWKYIVDAPGTENPGKFPFMKVKLKGTYLREVIGNKNSSEIYVDVFPIEYAPESKFLRLIEAPFFNLIRNIIYVVFMEESWNDVIKPLLKNCSASTSFVMYLGHISGLICSLIPLEKWLSFFDRIVQKKESEYATIPTGAGGYLGQLFPAKTWLDSTEGEFSGLKVRISSGYDELLRRQYGDYMTPPPEDKRNGGHYHIGGIIWGKE